MKSISYSRSRFFRGILAFVMVFALTVGSGGAAFAVPGTVVGLADLPTSATPRPNTLDVNMSDIAAYTLEIYPLIATTGQPAWSWFESEKEAMDIAWSQNTTGMNNVYIDATSAQAVSYDSGTRWYYTVEAYLEGNTMGPDSWRATYNNDANAYGDFSFVATDYTAPDSGKVSTIGIEFWDGIPELDPLIASGDFTMVNGNDDYAPYGTYGRSYATAMDSVAHGTLYPPYVISTYTKTFGTAMLDSIMDMNGNKYQGDGEGIGWMYGVYMEK